MPRPLDEWQERLERHFESLAKTRAGSGFPIFAFEHGLADEDLEEISSLLRTRIKSGLNPSPHWLLWIIYATERGYAYAGDEYWPSFQAQTPGWEPADNYRIVPWFTKFQKTYDGVIPSGPWATHFKIIAWPITHAILPRYLQRQFAEALYYLRFRLASLDRHRPAAIGRLLASGAYHASTRFEEFLQQEELTGRIVLALLGENPVAGIEPIYPPTLGRIVADLERVRSAREWLKETQRVVADRFTGIGRGTGPPGQRQFAHLGNRGIAREEPLCIRPSLFLRYMGTATWSLVLEVPSFRNVAALNADIRTFLRSTRCRLGGGSDTKPAGWLLSENRKSVLKSWPEPGKPLIQFSEPHAIIDQLLEAECRHSAGPLWLFRISTDGTAREITGHIVRPGYEYIVLSAAELQGFKSFLSPCSVQCSGVRAFQLHVPPAVSPEDIAWLHRLGLQVARTIRVWPAGLPARGWDGEGNGEWLTTEAPCFGIAHDYPVDAYELRLDHGAETIIEAGGLKSPTFVRLSPLPPGRHTLSVKARRKLAIDIVAPSPPAEGFIQLNVREPEPWIPGVLSHPGLIVTLDPHDADLDTFWKNEVSLSVLGPESHTVSLIVSLEAMDGREIFADQVDGPMDLPVTPVAWSRRFAQFVRREDCAWSYLEAARGRLTVRGEVLGECILRFEHDVLPLRWVLRHDHGKIILRLVDDTGREESKPEILFYSMTHPLKEEAYSPENALSGIVVAQPGGLYVAKHGNHIDTVVVSAGITGAGLQGLGVRPGFIELQNGSMTIGQSLAMFDFWLDARLAGFLPDIRRQQVIDGLLGVIYDMLCGSNWARAETAFLVNPHSEQSADLLQRAVDRHGGFAAVLRRDYPNIGASLAKASHWYTDVAARYHVCTERNLSEFALRLASQPQRLSQSCGEDLNGLLNAVRGNPTVLRGARLLALLCANQNRSGAALLLPRWQS